MFGAKQFSLTDDRNLWIIKPGAQSRGRGIEIHSDLDEIMHRMTVSPCTMWIAQKYIERPLIILGKKFDIRQWVLITSVTPLTIWLWMTPYLRFTSQDYNPANAKNKFQHLTNASVSKHDTNGQKVKQVGNHVIRNNMWETHQMQAYLIDQCNLRQGDCEGQASAIDPWNEKIVP